MDTSRFTHPARAQRIAELAAERRRQSLPPWDPDEPTPELDDLAEQIVAFLTEHPHPQYASIIARKLDASPSSVWHALNDSRERHAGRFVRIQPKRWARYQLREEPWITQAAQADAARELRAERLRTMNEARWQRSEEMLGWLVKTLERFPFRFTATELAEQAGVSRSFAYGRLEETGATFVQEGRRRLWGLTNDETLNSP